MQKILVERQCLFCNHMRKSIVCKKKVRTWIASILLLYSFHRSRSPIHVALEDEMKKRE